MFKQYFTLSNVVSFALGVVAGLGSMLLFMFWLTKALEGIV